MLGLVDAYAIKEKVVKLSPISNSHYRQVSSARTPSCGRLYALPKAQSQHKPHMTHIALHVRDLEASRAFYEEYCGVRAYNKGGMPGRRTLWLAEPGLEDRFVYVLFDGSKVEPQAQGDFSHVGLSVETREDVDAIAALGKERGILAYGPLEQPYPVGYLCMLRDPDGRLVEFSYGQPLNGFGEDGNAIKV